MPRVSVITPTYNCAQFLERAMQSVFAQTYVDYEIIVVDDGSTDETQDLIARWDGEMHYVYQSNHGLSSARNLGVSKASGEFIAYLDADDMWYPHKLEQQVAFLDNYPECGFVHSDLTVVDENDRVMFPDWIQEARRSAPRGFCVTDLLHNCHIQVPTVVERRTCYDRIGGFDERLRRVEDYLHWIQIVLNGHAVGYIDEPLAMYRWRTGSLSRNQAAMAEAMIQMFRILIEENALLERLGPAAEEVVRRRVAKLERGLASQYRWQGHNDLAWRQAAALIRESPRDIGLYVELMKASVPVSLTRALRRLRELVG